MKLIATLMKILRNGYHTANLKPIQRNHKEVQDVMIEYYNRDKSKDTGAVEQWGTMSNKEIRAMDEIEQPTLF